MKSQDNFTVHLAVVEDRFRKFCPVGATLLPAIASARLVPVWPSLVRTEVHDVVQYRMTGARP